MLKNCSQQFRKLIRQFDDTEECHERNWIVRYIAPEGAPGFGGSLAFSGAQILSCLKPSVDMVVKALQLCVGRMHSEGGKISVRIPHRFSNVLRD